jgi:hypothetical protein
VEGLGSIIRSVLSVIDGELGVEGSPTHFNRAVVELALSDEIIYVHKTCLRFAPAYVGDSPD